MTRKLLSSLAAFRPVRTFCLERPVVLFHSDDWGLAGVADPATRERLAQAGIACTSDPWDSYSLETADDLSALYCVLAKHRDGSGRSPSIAFNFIVANVDFPRVLDEGLRQLHLRPLARGLPPPWQRDGLLDGYREGIARGLVYPALHGLTHFCRRSVEEALAAGGERREQLTKLYREGVAKLHSQTPWLGFEMYSITEGWLSQDRQERIVARAAEGFRELVAEPPLSGCAPSYRANADTFRAWRSNGLAVIQEGVEVAGRPYLDPEGLLHLPRTVSFEPALHGSEELPWATLEQVERAFAHGAPAVISCHSINFQSSLVNHRDRTLELLDRLLAELESRHPDLLYLDDGDLHEVLLGQSGDRPAEVPWTSRKQLSPAARRALRRRLRPWAGAR